MPDFNSVLDKKAVETEKPKPRPLGTYLGIVSDLPKVREMNTKKGERSVIDFNVRFLAATSVEDQDTLAAQGDLSLWPELQYTLWPDTPEGEYQLQQFLVNVMGLDLGKKSYKELLAECPGKQVSFTVKHEPYTSKAGTPEIGTRIDSIMRA